MSTQDNKISESEMELFNRQMCNPLPTSRRSRRNCRQELPNNPTAKFEEFSKASVGLTEESKKRLMDRACQMQAKKGRV